MNAKFHAVCNGKDGPLVMLMGDIKGGALMPDGLVSANSHEWIHRSKREEACDDADRARHVLGAALILDRGSQSKK